MFNCKYCLLPTEHTHRICDECMKEMDVSHVQIVYGIKEVLATYGKTPLEINKGECDKFAYLVLDHIFVPDPGEYIMETPGFLENNLPGHYWITFNHRHYDAETPEGVDDWKDLPIFKRES